MTRLPVPSPGFARLTRDNAGPRPALGAARAVRGILDVAKPPVPIRKTKKVAPEQAGLFG